MKLKKILKERQDLKAWHCTVYCDWRSWYSWYSIHPLRLLQLRVAEWPRWPGWGENGEGRLKVEIPEKNAAAGQQDGGQLAETTMAPSSSAASKLSKFSQKKSFHRHNSLLTSLMSSSKDQVRKYKFVSCQIFSWQVDFWCGAISREKKRISKLKDYLPAAFPRPSSVHFFHRPQFIKQRCMDIIGKPISGAIALNSTSYWLDK